MSDTWDEEKNETRDNPEKFAINTQQQIFKQKK